MMLMKKRLISWIAVCLVVMIAACGSEESAVKDGREKTIELVILQDQMNIRTDHFKKWIAEPVSRKYPHISLELRPNIVQPKELEYLIIKGEFPDLILTSLAGILKHREMLTALDLLPFLSQMQLNPGLFDQAAIEAIRNGGSEEALYALPFSLDFGALFYNIDRFDARHLDYPTDGMTWEDVFKLSRENRLNAQVPLGIADLGGQLSLEYIHATTGRVDIHTHGWRRVSQLYGALSKFDTRVNSNSFIERGNTALMLDNSRRLADLQLAHERGSAINWDLAQYPSYPEYPDVGPGVSGQFLIVSTLSQYQVEALQVISVVTGEENQLAMAKSGVPSALSDLRTKDQFATDNPFLQGKNYKSVFKSKPARPYIYTAYDPYVLAALNEVSKELAQGNRDINTMMRIAQEKADQLIEEKKMGFK